jgi:isopentenyl-diphosphate delta-isomerase
MHRAPNIFFRQLAGTFLGWGIPTAESIQNVRNAAPGMMIFASGGLKDGMDIIKCIALGATMGGMAGEFLKAAAASKKKTAELIQLTKKQIQVTMFAAGIGKMNDVMGKLLEW